MSDLAEFLAARLDEREAEAHELHDGLRCASIDRDGGFEPERCDCGEPDRVRREVAAKRAILARHRPEPRRYIESDRCPRCEMTWPCVEVSAIAAVWSDHPGYRQEWGLALTAS